jgi:hypothetical protein
MQRGPYLTFFKPRKCISLSRLPSQSLLRVKVTLLFSATILLNARIKKIHTDGLPTRTRYQLFLGGTPRSSFKKLIISTLSLLQGLHSISLAKSVPDVLKPQECKRLHLREPSPVPYMPEKDEIQEEVSKMKNLQIKTSIKKDTTLNFPVWYNNGTKEAFLMHMTVVLDAIKKRGHFKDYKDAQKAYGERKEAGKPAKAGLALLTEPAKGQEN